MAKICFDESAPCGFLLLKGSGKNKETVLIQTDWDFPGVASTIGWKPCKCGSTDGTVDCKNCNRTASEMITEAYIYLYERNGKRYKNLDVYFEGDCENW